MALRDRKNKTEEYAGATEEWSPAADYADVSEQQVEPYSENTVVAEVMRQSDPWDAETMRGISTFEEALRLAEEEFGTVEDASEVLGDGFAVTNDDAKARLVGLPLLLMSWSFYKGEYGSDFVAVRAVASHGSNGITKHIINDGSTGVREMIRAYEERTGRKGGLVARKGLRPSEYRYCEVCQTADSRCVSIEEHTAKGKLKKATTYYIDTSA